MKMRGSLLKRAYRLPMDWLEEVTTRAFSTRSLLFLAVLTERASGNADIILANSSFTSRVFKAYFPSISQEPRVVHPGINLLSYQPVDDSGEPDILMVSSYVHVLVRTFLVFMLFPRDRQSFLSLNRFEKKKNVALAIDAFTLFNQKLAKTGDSKSSRKLRLVIGGGYDPRVEENMMTLITLIDRAKAASLSYSIVSPPSAKTTIPPFNMTTQDPDVVFLLNFTSAQRAALLSAPSTLALLYTPANEHFGIVPVEAMSAGLPVLACNSGGPTESIVDDSPAGERTGWLRAPSAQVWAEALVEISGLSPSERSALAERARARAREHFGMEAMAVKLEKALQEAAEMGPVPTPATLWFGSFVAVAVFAYFMATIYAL
jgi:alpha-1,3/alpha-1,6-mannosyltransferase